MSIYIYIYIYIYRERERERLMNIRAISGYGLGYWRTSVSNKLSR